MSGPYSDFAHAQSHIGDAVRWLRMARISYVGADHLPEDTKRARLAAIDAKIDALVAVQLNDKAHPWIEDKVLR